MPWNEKYQINLLDFKMHMHKEGKDLRHVPLLLMCHITQAGFKVPPAAGDWWPWRLGCYFRVAEGASISAVFLMRRMLSICAEYFTNMYQC